jgi:hypothetical protein
VPTTAPSSAIVGYRGERDSERGNLETDIPSTSGYAILA